MPGIPLAAIVRPGSRWYIPAPRPPGPLAARSFSVNKQTMNTFKKLLEEKREQMVKDVEETRSRSAEDTEEEDKDYIDVAVSSYTKEFLLTLSDLERKQLDHVDRALEAIKSGTFGTCEECGEDIEAKRLDALPWAIYCLKCQELSDRGLLRARGFGDDEE